MTNEEVARAFSEHRFQDAYPFISPEVRWNVVGGAVLPGKRLLMQSCGRMLDELDGVEVEFTRFRLITAGETIVVESLAQYTGDEPSAVAACDIYEFEDGLVSAITSFNVDVQPARSR